MKSLLLPGYRAGDTLTLFAASIALLALLVASYTGRSTWLAGGSTSMSMAILVGCIFLSTNETPSQIRVGLTWFVSQLSPVLDQGTVRDVTAAIDQFSNYSICDEEEPVGCIPSVGRIESPTSHIHGPRTAEAGSAPLQAMQAASATGWLEAKKNSNEAARSPVIWLFNEPGAPVSSGIPGFSITGINVSNESLTRVRATLKPDSSIRDLSLVLSLQENKLEGESVIPSGARFRLAFETPNTNSPKQGGAIFTLRYTFAGRDRALIMYLTPEMIGRSANRG